MIRHTKNKEFLLTDGKGGYSFLPLDWKNKRKYHSFFTSSLGGPSRRFVLFSAVDGLTPNRFIFPNQFEASDFSSSVLLGDGFRLIYMQKEKWSLNLFLILGIYMTLGINQEILGLG